MEAANLSAFQKFGKTKKSKICVIFAKKSWVATKLGGWSKTGGLSPRPGPKTGLFPILSVLVSFVLVFASKSKDVNVKCAVNRCKHVAFI